MEAVPQADIAKVRMPLKSAGQTCPDLLVPVTPRDHVEGPHSAAVIMVEYGDYECPSCLNAFPIVRQIRQQLGDRLAFVFRHFPQNSIHPHASVAAQAAEAAGAQGKFWDMHELLFRHQQELGSVDLTHLALQLGLEVYQFESDLEAEPHLRRIREDFSSGSGSGVRGTPTFFLNGCRYNGPIDAAALTAAIEAADGGLR